MDRNKLREELIRDEGRKLMAYRDTLGYWTIGVGHLLGIGVKPRMAEITHDEADALLMADMDIAETRAREYVTIAVFIRLSEVRQRVLVNMAFNLGGKLKNFKKFLAAVHVQDWAVAAAEMMDSRWAEQVGARAVRLRDMMLEG